MSSKLMLNFWFYIGKNNLDIFMIIFSIDLIQNVENYKLNSYNINSSVKLHSKFNVDDFLYNYVNIYLFTVYNSI